LAKLSLSILTDCEDDKRMVIDGHVHAAGKFANTEQITKVLDKLGVDKIVLCPSLKNNTQLKTPKRISIPAVSSTDKYFLLNHLCRLSYKFLLRDQGDGNAFVQSLVQQHPQRIIQFYWLNPQGWGSIQQLDGVLEDWSIKGIKLHQACDPFRNDSSEMHQVAGFAGERQLPIFIHPYSKREVGSLIGLARSYPKTNFIVAHLIGLEIVAGYASDLTNIYYDISGGDVINPERLEYALETFGAERLILGSDEPFGSLENSLARVRRLNISEAHKELVLGENLRTLCRLGDQ
jgi:predicted TIM-barrel fold metal-dependent hydrolase